MEMNELSVLERTGEAISGDEAVGCAKRLFSLISIADNFPHTYHFRYCFHGVKERVTANGKKANGFRRYYSHVQLIS